jgi:hypothetical protein
MNENTLREISNSREGIKYQSKSGRRRSMTVKKVKAECIRTFDIYNNLEKQNIH